MKATLITSKLMLLFVLTFVNFCLASRNIDEELLKAMENDARFEVNKLVNEGADVNVADSNGITPFLYAVSKKSTQFAMDLRRRGADERVVTRHGINVIDLASYLNFDHELKTNLLDLKVGKKSFQAEEIKDEEINRSIIAGITPLHWATFIGSVENVEILLNRGSNVNLFDVNRITPLMLAACKGNLELYKMLIAHGASVKLLDKQLSNFLINNELQP